MKYEKPSVEMIDFGSGAFFMALSSESVYYSSAQDALNQACGGYNGGATNNFTCSDFGGYNASNPPKQNCQVILSGGNTYVYDYKGNHWKLHKGG